MIWGMPIKPLPFKLVVQEREEMWRACDFWVKEPETIAWIDSFEPDSVFWDIGANIGVFSLYAVSKDGIEVRAFEPVAENYDRIIENGIVNLGRESGAAVRKRLWAKKIAFSDSIGTKQFFSNGKGAGRSGGQVGAPVDEMGAKFTPTESYEVEVTTIDQMAKSVGVPNYIKIDVDGHEEAIIRGAVNTLCNPLLRSVLVETRRGCIVDNVMDKAGFITFNQFMGVDLNRRRGQKRMNVVYTRAHECKSPSE